MAIAILRAMTHPLHGSSPRLSWLAPLALLLWGCTADLSDQDEQADEDLASTQDALWALRVSLPSQLRLFSFGTPSCLGVVDGSTKDNARVEPMPCSLPGANRWVVETTYAGTSYAVVAVRNVDTDKCLDAGTALPQQFTCHGGPAQQWTVVQNGVDLFGLHNDSRNRSLRTASGHEWFQLDPSIPSTRGLELRARAGNSWCVDVPGFAQGTIDMQVYPCNNGPNQRFQLHPWGDSNDFTMRPVHSGKCIEQRQATSPSPVSQFFACDGFQRQRWSLFYGLTTGDYSIVQQANPQQGLFASGYDLDSGTPAGRWLVR